MNNLTKIQTKEIKSLYEMINLKWHYTNHPMHYKFMQSHNDLKDYES